MSVRTVNHFKRNSLSALHGIEITAGSTKTTFTAKRDKLKISAMLTAEGGESIGKIAAMKHSVNIFDNRWTYY